MELKHSEDCDIWQEDDDEGGEGEEDEDEEYTRTKRALNAAQAKREAFKKLKDNQDLASKSMDFDDLLPHVGEFGRYQKLLIYFICLPACIPCGFHAFNQLFMSPVPPHWCSPPPELAEAELGQDVVRNLSVPYHKEHGYDQCQMYDVNYTQILQSEVLQPNPSWPVMPCRYGWTYNTSVIFSSIVIDFDLVCDKAIFPTVGLSVLNIGGIIGVYLFGTISDKFGRRISFLTCLAIEQIFGFLTAFSPNFWIWTACRFFVGLTIPAIYQIPFIISLELVGPTYRSFVTVLTCLFYVGGMLLLAGVAYLVRDWVYLCLVTSLPFFSYILYWWFLPESPRWLLSQGRLNEANQILQSMAKVNRTELPQSFTEKLKARMISQQAMSVQSAPTSSTGGMCKICSTPNMRFKTILITLTWFANESVYVGLSYYGPAMGENEYLSFFLACAVEVPSYLLCWIVMDRWGRRWILAVGMIVGGVFATITVVMPEDASQLTLALYLISKFAESAAFLIIYPFAGELYPTEVRGIGIGFSSYVGGLGLVIIPFINYLGTEMLVLPLFIMGIISVVGGFAALRLPETLQQKLPNTLAEGEEFGKNFKWNECLTCVPGAAEEEEVPESEPLEEIVSLEDLDQNKSANGGPARPTEMTPLQKAASLKERRGMLMKQASVIGTPIITDSSGAMKLTFWV